MGVRPGSCGDLLIALLTAVLLYGCNSPEDVGHRLYGYVDAQGGVIIAPRYLAALPFRDGLAAVRVREGCGFIDRQGQWVIPAQFRAVGSFADGRAAAIDPAGLWGYVDTRGGWAVRPQYRSAARFNGGSAFVTMPDGHGVLIDPNGRVIADGFTDETTLQLTDGLIGTDFGSAGAGLFRGIEQRAGAVRSTQLIPAAVTRQDGPDQWGYVNPAGHWVIEPAFDNADVFVAGRARVRKDGMYGFVDLRGNVVVPYQFEHVLLRYSQGRTVGVRDAHAWLVDTEGREVADLGAWPWSSLGKDEDFDDLANYLALDDFFADGLIPWQRDGKWGYVGVDGRWVIEPRFDAAQPFRAGTASVQVRGRGLLIDTAGRAVAQVAGGWIGSREHSFYRVGTETRWGFTDDPGKSPASSPFANQRLMFANRLFADARPLQYSEGLAIVSRMAPHRWRLIDGAGNTRAEARFDWLEFVAPGRYAFFVDGHWGLADDKLKVLAKAQFDDKPSFFERRDAAVRVDGRGGCLDRRGRWRALPGDAEGATCRPGMLAATKSGQWGAIDRDGHWRVAPIYRFVWRLDDPGKRCFELHLESQFSAAGALQIACVRDHDVFYSPIGVHACESAQACLVQIGNKWRRLDLGTLKLKGAEYDEVTGVQHRGALVRQGTHWGLMDPSGRLAMPVRYDEITLNDTRWDSPDGAAAVRSGDLWGVVRRSDGRQLLPVEYAEAHAVGAGVYAVKEGLQWRVVRDGGTAATTARFDRIVEVTDGLMLAYQDGRANLVTLEGRAVEQPAPEWMQRIDNMADFSDRAWAVLTSDRELYFIDKVTLAVHEHAAPPGHAWRGTGPMTGMMQLAVAGSDLESAQLRYQLLDATGRPVVPQLFDEADAPFKGPHRFTVTLRGRCGVLDERGRWVVPLQHDHCSDPFQGHARLVVGDEDY